jgi:hypothetical protein
VDDPQNERNELRRNFMKHILLLCVFALTVVAAGCGGAPTETASEAPEPQSVELAEAAVEQTHDTVYACNCGPDCDCGSVAVAPGPCECGTELEPAKLLKVEGNEGLLCSCGGGCSCSINADDDTQCSCGKPVRRVSFEGTGLYYCNCGGSCTCNHVVAEPGTCHCGMDLVTS